MSILSNNNSEFLSVRITQKGRNSIAKGSFNIAYFQIGDSEFDYTSPFDNFTGLDSQPFQMVFAPFDRDANDNSKSGENYLTVRYEKIVPLLIEGIKELLNRVENLEKS